MLKIEHFLQPQFLIQTKYGYYVIVLYFKLLKFGLLCRVGKFFFCPPTVLKKKVQKLPVSSIH